MYGLIEIFTFRSFGDDMVCFHMGFSSDTPPPSLYIVCLNGYGNHFSSFFRVCALHIFFLLFCRILFAIIKLNDKIHTFWLISNYPVETCISIKEYSNVWERIAAASSLKLFSFCFSIFGMTVDGPIRLDTYSREKKVWGNKDVQQQKPN